MFDQFRSVYAQDQSSDGPTRPWFVNSLVDAEGYVDFAKEFAGVTFSGGLYRIHDEASGPRARGLISDAFPEFRDRACPFGFDWLGRQFAIDSGRADGGEPLVVLLEPGTGEALEIPATFQAFHEEELIDFAEAALARTFFQEFRGFATNLQLLKASRKKQKPGDVFVLRIADEKYLYGRIIRNDALWTLRDPGYRGDDARANLAYVYDHVAVEPEPLDLAILSRDRLLIPPFFVDGLWWSRGYFQTMFNAPLAESDVLPRHCFQRPSSRRFYDEFNNELDDPIEPIGSLSLPTIGWIDSKLSVALGIPEVDYSQYVPEVDYSQYE